MRLVPLKRKEAQEFVREYHRHSKPPVGDIFRVGVEHEGRLVAVMMVGRPVARPLDDGRSLEVLRVCAREGAPRNVNSFLYGAAYRAGKALGYDRMYTYTLERESGESLRGSGWFEDEHLKARAGWDTPSRRRDNEIKRDPGPKIRWRKDL